MTRAGWRKQDSKCSLSSQSQSGCRMGRGDLRRLFQLLGGSQLGGAASLESSGSACSLLKISRSIGCRRYLVLLIHHIPSSVLQRLSSLRGVHVTDVIAEDRNVVSGG